MKALKKKTAPSSTKQIQPTTKKKAETSRTAASVKPNKQREKEHIEPELMTVVMQKKLQQKKMTIEEAAEYIGVSYSYLRFLLAGKNQWRMVSALYFRAVAKLVDMSTAEALSVAGILDSTDFVSPEATLEDELNGLYSAMMADRRLVTLLPSKKAWLNADREMQLYVANLYQMLGTQEITRQLSAPEPSRKKR